MIATTTYQCEVCGAYYYTEKECVECEHKHGVAVEIKDVYYKHGERYPKVLSVKMSDGTLKMYHADVSLVER